MKTLTLSEFRKEPGEVIREVNKQGKSFLLTKSGTPVARLISVEDVVVIHSDGTVTGELPVTFKVHLGDGY
jgi:prevent-host-death family protein